MEQVVRTSSGKGPMRLRLGGAGRGFGVVGAFVPTPWWQRCGCCNLHPHHHLGHFPTRARANNLQHPVEHRFGQRQGRKRDMMSRPGVGAGADASLDKMPRSSFDSSTQCHLTY